MPTEFSLTHDGREIKSPLAKAIVLVITLLLVFCLVGAGIAAFIIGPVVLIGIVVVAVCLVLAVLGLMIISLPVHFALRAAGRRGFITAGTYTISRRAFQKR